jgi:hypothetical protein
MDCTQFDELESLFAVIELLDEDDLQPFSAVELSIRRSQKDALQRQAWDLANGQQNRGLPDRAGIGYLPPRINTNTTIFECNACTESFPAVRLITLNCSHQYYRNYTQHMFTASISGAFPQCCRERITLSTARSFLTTTQIQQHEAVEIERNTANKVYYSNRACGLFIALDHAGPEEAYCQACGRATCSKCKAPSTVAPVWKIHSCKKSWNSHLQTAGSDALNVNAWLKSKATVAII